MKLLKGVYSFDRCCQNIDSKASLSILMKLGSLNKLMSSHNSLSNTIFTILYFKVIAMSKPLQNTSIVLDERTNPSSKGKVPFCEVFTL